MTTRRILYVLMLIAYTLSLAHSVIPHHHHSSVEEATVHHQHNHQPDEANHHVGHSHHQHDDHEKNESHEHAGHLFFFTHDVNIDFLTAHNSIDNPVKAKKSTTLGNCAEEFISFEIKRHLVFHPPQDDTSHYNTTICQHKLRGPPAFVS